MSEIDIHDLEPKPISIKAKLPKQKSIKFPKPKINNIVVAEKPLKISDVPDELQGNMKGLVLHCISLPAKEKQKILQIKLSNSKFVNQYLNKYLLIDNIAGLNDHIKFSLVYAFNFLETKMMQIPLPEVNEPLN